MSHHVFNHVRPALLVCLCTTLVSSLVSSIAFGQGLLPPPRNLVPPPPEDAPTATPNFWPPPPAREPPPAPLAAPADAAPEAAPPAETPAPPPPPVVSPPSPPAISARPIEDGPGPGAWTHDRFYLRLTLGLGGLGSSAEASGQKQEIGGGALSLGAAAGWTVARNLIVYGEWFHFSADKPKSKVNGVELSARVGNANINGLGVGAAYYFQRLNIFASGTLAISRFQMQADDGNTRYQSKRGLGLHFMLGKEWWVSQQWGIGVAATLATMSAEDRDLSAAKWRATAGGVAFVATCN